MLKIGDTFDDVLSLQWTCAVLSAQQNRTHVRIKSEAKRFEVVCPTTDCGFRVAASLFDDVQYPTETTDAGRIDAPDFEIWNDIVRGLSQSDFAFLQVWIVKRAHIQHSCKHPPQTKAGKKSASPPNV